MKCPKCEYLGFETGDRCKNCGYDFSLMLMADSLAAPDLPLNVETPTTPNAWLDDLDREFGHPATDGTAALALPEAREPTDALMVEGSIGRTELAVDVAPSPSVESGAAMAPPERAELPHPAAVEPAAAPEPVAAAAAPRFELVERSGPDPSVPGEPAGRTKRRAQVLPLFAPKGGAEDDEPLIKVPAAPRAPLGVRRTPDAARLRAFARPAREAEPAFEFAESAGAASDAPTGPRARRAEPAATMAGPGRRVAAAAIDHAILLAIDVSVVYFTLKVSALQLADWRIVPIAPMLAFLLFFKLGYFTVFTAVGGQTIGKMGVGIRVVADEGRLDAARAVQRALTAALSVLTLGATFLPALLGADRLAVHDRVGRTRVVLVP